MTATDAEKWNNIYQSGDDAPAKPALVLAQNIHLLPRHGSALDLACGRGGNALLLAQNGLTVSAWDIADIAVRQLEQVATEKSLPIKTEVRDVVSKPPLPATFDSIVVSYFLERSLFPHLVSALKPGGLLFYQTFIKDKVSDTGPKNPDYRLGKNELLALCRNLQIIFYREEGNLGDINQGFRNEAMLIGQRLES